MGILLKYKGVINMIKLLLIFLWISTSSFAQQTTIATANLSDQGWYVDTGIRGAWNFAGICFRNKVYYRKALSRNNASFLFQNSYLETGVELGIAPFMKTSAFVVWQPILPLRFNLRVGHYKDLLGEPLIDGPNGGYDHGYLAFTGLNPGNVTSDKINSDTLEIEFAPTLTLGGKVGSAGALAFIYTPYMHYFYSSNMKEGQYKYLARDSIVIGKQTFFWRHNFLFGYSMLDLGLTVGVSATIQHLSSISGIFRAGVFGVLAYEKTSIKNPKLTPYVRAQIGTWVKDRYLEKLFVIQAEFGIKYKFN